MTRMAWERYHVRMIAPRGFPGRRLWSSILWIAGIGWACGGAADTRERVAQADLWEGRAASEVFAELEEELLLADARRLAFDVRAEGGFSAELGGELHLHHGNALELHASGTFGADSVDVWLDGQGDHMAWGSRNGDHREPLPAGLREGVVIGLTRMGVLHSLARLTAGAPPDRIDGTVRSWVEVEEVRWAEGEERSASRGISFDIRVAEQRAGRATVWLDQDGAMVGRDQVVEFPGGEMTVRERYCWDE